MQGIVKKVSFPREILALAQVGTAICYFFFQSCIMVVFLVGFQVVPDWKYFPVALLALVCDIVLSAALADLPVGGQRLPARRAAPDRGPARGAVLQPADRVPVRVGRRQRLSAHHLLWIYLANPLVVIVLSFQRFIYGNVAPLDNPNPLASYGEAWYFIVLGIVLVVAICLFLLAMLIFGRVEGNFAEEL